MLTVLSYDPDAKYKPSGEKETLYTGKVWFEKVNKQAPLSEHQTLTLVSNEALHKFTKKHTHARDTRIIAYI